METIEKLTQEFNIQLRTALKIARDVKITKPAMPIQHVVVLGIGGSGFGGSLTQTLIFDQLKIPFIVAKGYEIPHFVNANSLVIACSFSGNTEETIAQTEKAIQNHAHVTGITSGGKLEALCEKHQFDCIKIPGESQCPRASFGYTLLQIFAILTQHNLIDGYFFDEFEKAERLITESQDNIKTEAHDLAEKIHGHLPVFYADSTVEPVLLRAQQQINENAKQIAHFNALPEMNHNELVGWDNPQKTILKDSVVILLRSKFEAERVSKRIEICKPTFKKSAAEVIEVSAKGESLTEQMLYLIHLVDWVSFYLSECNQVDAFQINVINHLKSALAQY